MKNFSILKLTKWSKKNLFNGPVNSVISIFVLALIWKVFEALLHWLFFDAVWFGDANSCREASGACMSFVIHKARFILFGFYPDDQLWRPILMILSLIGLSFYSMPTRRWSRKLFITWTCYFVFVFVLIRGGFFGLEHVDTSKWGGLPLTLILSVVGIIASYPLGIILALGRRSDMPLIKSLCVGYIELIRGVPMISLLFMSSVMFPLFLPEGLQIEKLLRAQIAIIMFVSAYMAEVIRAGLQAIDKGQYEAAASLGLNYFQTMRFIILPQALKIVIPPTVNTSIGLFKDTSLVVIIALFDLLSGAKSSIQDGEWLGFSVEAYLFAGVIYFIFCYSMSRYSQNLEKEFNTGYNR
ncbi:putative amino acid ABC transporter, permease protein [Bacteriovorax sp. BSW11_IV]|uniref:amino acid ABC transporter permease n=1 Tax=Bacteriovorax sp. BSW11_IV TaxID=1353529 RepID=UPI00038A414D|nr:amino acid ABC transporter permease [Bacteriovorax sp. BSW11_IV]EQC44992.1 putative amino acid ABC transporter, permease protein [Bacteriovorax sp. BSW11_IV]